MLRKERPGISQQSSYPEHAAMIEAPLTNAAAPDHLEPGVAAKIPPGIYRNISADLLQRRTDFYL